MNLPARALHLPDDVYNARENGLVGNGVTNDQPALAALVSRLGAAYANDRRPRVIYCPPGEYLIADATTVWASGVSLTGAGAGATRFLLANHGRRNSAVALARYNDKLDGASVKQHLGDCTFSSFEVDGSRVELEKYDPRAKALDLQYMLRPMFRDLHLHHTAATGLGCDHLQDGTISGVIADRCGRLNNGREPGGAGIGIGIGGWGRIERLDIIDCICTGNARHGIFVELQKGMPHRPRGLKILGCHCVDNRYGISDWGAEGLIVSSCILCENHEVGFDVSADGTAGVAGRGGTIGECLIDGNGRDGVSIGNTHGAYTVRSNRISYNGRFGYYQHNTKNDPSPAREIVIEANEIWKNGLDGVHLGAPLLDASIVHNRIRNNGRRVAGNVSRAAPQVTYTESGLRDAGARWLVDAHKGKLLLVAGMQAIVASNNQQELDLFPWRPGAPISWERGVPTAGTPYLLRDDDTRVRAGIAIAADVERAWIRGNRIWDNQEHCTQTHDLFTAEGMRCENCRIEDNGA
jgi:Pectate lyase superfamily protein